ncbi:hypothetical protein OG884_17440 [Streptosporangium sp. NBC_01755]|uniref:hypothetical protein n=1 Tax=Streptosporangium sp. NBC_01755 TaxID=2975949 RepID=UPI002DD90B36|nr:hypothetical protein [Streptosporangium sp. NBC_01755]WSD03594.1 hypothetical protein OG884_17440 [Streptosporangium sp. NBC_01755]
MPETKSETATKTGTCDSCPLRSTAENDSRGYCEGCSLVSRYCQSCESNKPQTGWGWGFYWGLLRWLCADCRFPGEADVTGSHPRFVYRLPVTGDAQRYAMITELNRAAGSAQAVGPASWVLTRMSRQLVDNPSGDIDIDVSDADLHAREAVSVHLINARNLGDQRMYQPLTTLYLAWSEFVHDSTPKKESPRRPEPTLGEWSAAMYGEQKVTSESPDGL